MSLVEISRFVEVERVTMLHFSDRPYVFRPARPIGPLVAATALLNRWRILRGKGHRIESLDVSGGEQLKGMERRDANRVLFLVNHPTHSDPHIMLEALSRVGRRTCFMVAYDVFRSERGRLRGWLMQRLGCFSVDREGSDRAAMSEAVRWVLDPRWCLTVFPEGNVYLRNDRVMPLLDGAAFIAFKAQKEAGAERPVHVVPVSIKVTCASDWRPVVQERVRRLARDCGCELNENEPLLGELKRIGIRLLQKNLAQRGLVPPGELAVDSIRPALEKAAEAIVERLETRMELAAGTRQDVEQRIRRIRGAIHQIRIDPERKADHQVAVAWADEAMTALRLLSYSGDYIDEAPTLDRFAESVEKLMEDCYGEIQLPPGPRHATVHFNEPIRLSDRLPAFEKKARTAVSQLTMDVEASIQTGLDTLNAANRHPGAKPFVLQNAG